MDSLQEKYKNIADYRKWGIFGKDLVKYSLRKQCSEVSDAECIHILSNNKKRVRQKTFNSLSLDLYEKLLEFYRIDFEIFGYNYTVSYN